MTIRRWRGPLVLEDTQTGDGRVIAAGAVYWADPPLPFAYLAEGDQHVMASEAPQIGTVETLERVGKEIIGTGGIDDEIPEGAELVRRMENGSAANGARQFVSIDADDWEVEIIDTNPGDGSEDELVILASGLGYEGSWPDELPGRTAAAGDPDPTGGEVIMEAAADEIIERATRLRIRGATACAVSAFDGAYIELINDADEAEPEPAPEDEAPVVAASFPAPSADWFADPKLTGPTPLTVDDDGRVFGHVAAWNTCHTGRQDVCLMAPRSPSNYAYFRTGEVRCADGSRVRTGPLTVGMPHADLKHGHRSAAAHYDDTRCAVADVVVGEDAYGIWAAGAVRGSCTEEQRQALMASAPSGDWRSIGGSLELIAVLMVNAPGFPVPALAASAVDTRLRVRVEAGECMALVAAGRLVKPDPIVELTRRMDAVEAFVADLNPVIVEQYRRRVHGA